MNAWHDIEPKKGDNLNVIVEVPERSRVKYELDKDTGLIKLDRVLYSPMHYPVNYGFTPRTLWDDGDPLDVMVLSYESLVPGCILEARVIGALPMNDSGDDDIKILAVPVKDPRFADTNDITDVQEHLLKETKHFFTVYKDLQEKKVELGEWQSRDVALEAVEKSIKQYDEKFKKSK